MFSLDSLLHVDVCCLALSVETIWIVSDTNICPPYCSQRYPRTTHAPVLVLKRTCTPRVYINPTPLHLIYGSVPGEPLLG